MALFRKFFYQKLPDRLLEISERIYVFDCCFSAEVLNESEYKTYIENIVTQLQGQFSESSFMVFNFREGESRTQISDILSQYEMTVTEYPRHYKSCPILPTEIIHHFLRSSDSWLSLKGQQNVLLMHCERGGWPLLAFMLASLLLYRKQYNWEQRTLEMIYKQADKEVLRLLLRVDPQPSQLRYLQYISRKNWPPLDTPLVLDSLVLEALPKFECCRLVVRVYGQDPLSKQNTGPKLLFSSLKARRRAQIYPEMEVVKLVIGCGVQGDVVMECVNLRSDSITEEIMFRVMFHTAFVGSQNMTLTRDEVDLLWEAKDKYPKDFTAKVLFSDVGAVPYPIDINMETTDENDMDAASIDQFFQVKDSKVDSNPLVSQEFPSNELRKNHGSENGNQETVSKPKSTIDAANEISLTEGNGKKVEDSIGKVVVEEPGKEDRDTLVEQNASRSKSPPLKTTIDVVRNKSDKLLQYVTKRRPQSFNQKTSNGLVLAASPQVRIIPPSISSTKNRHNDSIGGGGSNSAQDDSTTSTDVVNNGRKQESALSSSSTSNAPTLVDDGEHSKKQEGGLTIAAQVLSDIISITCPKCGALIPSPSTCNRETPTEPKNSSQAPPKAPPPPPQPSKGPSVPQPPPPPLPPGGRNQPSKPQPPPPPLPPGGRSQPPKPQPPPPPLPPGGQNKPLTPPPPPPPRRRDPPPPPSLKKGVKTPEQSTIPGPPAPPRPHTGGPPCAPAPPGKASPPGPRGGPPSPPGGGGPPAPPPSEPKGSMGNRGRLTRSAPITTTTASGKQILKPLHWSKVTRVAKGTLWEEIQGRTQIEGEIDMSEIESLFSPIIAIPTKKSSQKKVAPKSEVIHLVDLRRANNTEIMLTKVKMPLPDMMVAALALDKSVLDADQIENLIKFCPTKEEMDLLKNYTGDMEKLGKCEQFFLELMKVPRVESKLRVFLFKVQFSIQAEDFKNNLTIVLSACDEVRNSYKLKEVMRIILVLGNTLNNGTARGGACGFKLDSLLKLNETRATNSRTTLMHYLGKVLTRAHPNILDFPQDFKSLEAASKIQLKSLAEEMQTLTKGLEKAKVELAASAKDGPISTTFCKTLKEFLGSAEIEVASVLKMYAIAGRNADSLAAYFGEDPSRCPFEQVALTLLNFMKSFVKSLEENIKEAELDRKRAEKEAAEIEKLNGGNSSGKEEENET